MHGKDDVLQNYARRELLLPCTIGAKARNGLIVVQAG